jgi:hypothetical protein
VFLTYVALGRWGISFLCGSFFLAQPVFIATERRLRIRKWPSAVRRAWTLTALGVSAPLIIEPMLQISQLGPNHSVDVPLTVSAVIGFLIVISGMIAMVSFVSLSCDRDNPSDVNLLK